MVGKPPHSTVESKRAGRGGAACLISVFDEREKVDLTRAASCAGRVVNSTTVSFPKARNDAQSGRFGSDVVLELVYFSGLSEPLCKTKQRFGHYWLDTQLSASAKHRNQPIDPS